MIKGLRTVIYPVTDLVQSKAWFSQVFGCSPYCDEAEYVGFSVGGFELGLVPKGEPGAQGGIVFWGIDDIEAEVDRIVNLGALIQSPVRDVGGAIKVVELIDPFGNILGLIENPGFDLQAVR